MTAEADRSWQDAEQNRFRDRLRRGFGAFFVRLRKGTRRLFKRLPFRHGFSSLTRRIVVLNLIGLAILVSGILYLNQFRAGLIDAKVQSLLTQGEIIAGALAASAGVDTDQVQLDPEKLLETAVRAVERRCRRRRGRRQSRLHHRSGARRADPAPPGQAHGKPRPHLWAERRADPRFRYVLFARRGAALRPAAARRRQARRAHPILAGGEAAHEPIRPAAL